MGQLGVKETIRLPERHYGIWISAKTTNPEATPARQFPQWACELTAAELMTHAAPIHAIVSRIAQGIKEIQKLDPTAVITDISTSEYLA